MTTVKVAERNAEFLLRELRQENGRLLRTWKASPEHVEGAGEAKLNGYLEDYATWSRACWSCTRPPSIPAGSWQPKNWLRP